jgi:integrase
VPCYAALSAILQWENGSVASIYKRDTTWYIKFYQKGRRIRRSLKTGKKTEALKLKEQIERELSAGRYQVDEVDTPIDEFWSSYLAWAKSRKRRKTIENESLFWRQFTQLIKPLKLGDVSRGDIEKFIEKRSDDGLKPISINDALRHLQLIYNYAIKLGYFSGPNPFQGVQRFKLIKNPPRYLDKKQIERVLDAAQQHGRDIHLVFALGIFAGLRKNEIVSTRWEWFDFKRKLVTLSSREDFLLKDSETRTIPLHDRLAAILEPYQEDEGFVFLSGKEEPGKNRYRYEFKRAFNSVLRQAELPWVTPHILRHTFASQLAMAGVSLYKISKWLGHSDVKTTQIYAHLQTHDEDINRF